MSLTSITSASAPTSMSRRAPCGITASGFISSRRCCAAASPQRRPERSPVAIICASSVPRSAEAFRPRCPIAGGGTIAIDQTLSPIRGGCVGAAPAVLDRFMGALNTRDQPALRATPHFHAGAYLGDSLARAGANWHHSGWDFRRVIAAGGANVHLDVQFTRTDNSVIGSFRSFWIVTKAGRAGPWRHGRASRIDLQDARPNFIAAEHSAVSHQLRSPPDLQ